MEEEDCETDKDLRVLVTAGWGRSVVFMPPLFPAYHRPTPASYPCLLLLLFEVLGSEP